MKLYNIVKQHTPTLFIIVSIIGTLISTYLFLTEKILSTQWTFIFILLFILIGILTTLFSRYDKIHKIKLPNSTNYGETKPHIHHILDTIFYIGLSFLLITLITNEIRSFPYIILLSLLTVTITASVLLSSDKNVINHALIKTIILFGTASLSIFKIFYWTGRDTWTHAAWNYQLAQDGFLFAGMGKELTNPLYHVAVAITEILPSLDVRTATIVAVTIPLIILFSLGVFIVARQVIGPQYAVLAVIIADFIGNIHYWSSWGQSTTYACMVFAIMLVPLFKLLSEEQDRHIWKWVVIFAFFVLTIALTHLYSTFILVMYLSGVLLAWFVVDVILNKKINPIPVTSAIIGLVIAAGYAIATNISFMLPFFKNGLEKLAGYYESPEEPSLDTDVQNPDTPVTPPISDVSIPGVDKPVIPDTEIIDTIISTDFNSLIQNCFTLVEPSIWVALLSTGIRYALILIPLVLGCLFVSKHCFKPNVHEFKRSMWYLLVPALMIFFLLFVTAFAYPSMADRPHYYLPIFLGLVLASIIWWYVTRGGEIRHISKSSLVVILLIVFIVVSLGTLCSLEEKAGLFEEKRVSYGHEISEIKGLKTLLPTLPKYATIYIDNEMLGPSRFVQKLNQTENKILRTNLNEYNPTLKVDDSFILFRDTLIGGATYHPIFGTQTELQTQWNMYNIRNQYPTMLNSITSLIYENGELQQYYLEQVSKHITQSTKDAVNIIYN